MSDTDLNTPPPLPSLGEAARYWLKLGFISFGGPAGQISMMHQELVEKRRWIGEKRFLHALNYCMLLPGPEAQQLATYMGWLMHGNWGGVIAGSLFVLPSLLLLMALTWVYLVSGHLPVVAGILYGIKPAVVAIVVFAAWRIGSRALQNRVLWGLAGLAFIAIFVFKLGFPLIVLGAAALGVAGGRWMPEQFRTGGGHGGSHKTYGAAVLDDNSPLPAHAQFKLSRLLVYAAAGVGIWVAVSGGLALVYGWQGALTQMAWFFTKAALLTFGGAYAVLPYVYQGGVEHYGWLNPVQMMDGLALGETTPGPLIMVVAFVGFIGAWGQAGFGDSLLLAGVAGAVVATFFTFLPSFIFIFLGAPFIETTHGNLTFTAPLTAITAAVVGVILNLAVFFAWHVLWPQASPDAPFAGGFDGFAALLALAAFAALFRFKQDIIRVIGACALLGVAYTQIPTLLG